jgi:hypothetical protein
MAKLNVEITLVIILWVTCLLRQKAIGTNSNGASLLRALRVLLKSIVQISERHISPKKANGINNAPLKDMFSFFTDKKEYSINNIKATLLYTYPKGMVATTNEIKETSSLLLGGRPILVSSAFLEVL